MPRSCTTLSGHTPLVVDEPVPHRPSASVASCCTPVSHPCRPNLPPPAPPSPQVASWWDYGYQTTAMANRTVIVDNNTWNTSHIATVGRAMASSEAKVGRGGLGEKGPGKGRLAVGRQSQWGLGWCEGLAGLTACT